MAQNELIQELHYDPVNGTFTRLKSNRTVKAGEIAGAIITLAHHSKQYVRIGVFGKYFYAHRLAFLYMLGRWPIGDIDHINQNSLDNSWTNLRECSHKENGKNQKKYNTNTSGHTGIHQRKNGKWRVRICVEGKHINVGTFNTYDLAGLARKNAEKVYDFHKNHGK